MIKHVNCEKKTKIYIPKIENPKILTCCMISSEAKNQQPILPTSEMNNDNQKQR